MREEVWTIDGISAEMANPSLVGLFLLLCIQQCFYSW